jgi:LysR family glycine cleavage system transcriptional activator
LNRLAGAGWHGACSAFGVDMERSRRRFGTGIMGTIRVLHPGSDRRPLSLSKLPPLTALRAFVVTARHLSFARASAELHVTPAAVGQQIRQLEALLGRSLFDRNAGQLALTAAGESILPALSSAFEQMLGAMAPLLSGERDPLSVSVAPSLAVKWLIPRLDGLRVIHPDIEVRVQASAALVDFSTGETDCAIRYGAGQYPDLAVERLMGEAVFPVASPALLSGRHPLRQPADLRHHLLLHDGSADIDESCPDWASWLRAAHLDLAAPGMHFNQSALVLEAAVAGHGVALAKARLAEGDLKAGRLVRPFGEAQELKSAYFFVTPRHKMRLPRVRLFRDWLIEEASRIAPLVAASPNERWNAVGIG